MAAIDELLENNTRYAEQLAETDLPSRPAKRLAVVACMDARVDPSALLGIREGDAHVIRNAGGIVTDDVIRSLVISQRLLGTREIMLIHHTDCGMMTFRGWELKESIFEETGILPLFSMETFSDLEEDVLQSIARVKTSPFVPYRDEIRGFVYDVGSGRLREVAVREAR